MADRWTIHRYQGPPVPERLSKEEQRAIRKRTGRVPQRPGVPGPVVVAPDGRVALAVSAYSEVRPDPDGRGLLSTAEVLVPPDAAGGPWSAVGRVEHEGIGWQDFVWALPDGTVVAEGIGAPRPPVDGAPTRSPSAPGFGGWAGAIVTSGPRTWVIDDLVRPADPTRRRWFGRPPSLRGRALGHRWLDPDGTEAARLTWVGDSIPVHHERPYEWRFDWESQEPPDHGALVGAAACALRTMAFAGSMLST